MQNTRKLTITDIPACRALWQARFDDSDAFCDWYFSCRFQPHLSIGFFEDDRLCSMAHGRRMQIYFEGSPIDVLMIGGVSTAVDCEGRGMMKQVLSAMETLGRSMDVAMLILATETPAIYKSSGFEVCAKALYAQATGENEQPLCFDKTAYDINAMLACCEIIGRTTPFFPKRTVTSMQSRIDELCCEGGGLLTLINRNGVLEGYAFCDPISARADEVIAGSTDGYRQLLRQLPRGTVAMLPPHLALAGERETGARLMCKPLSTLCCTTDRHHALTTAFCPETY